MPSHSSRPSSHRSSAGRNNGHGSGDEENTTIDKLDYRPGGRPLLLSPHDDGEGSGRPSQDTSYAGSFFEQVAEGVVDADRQRMRREVVRYISFFWALVCCLCAGSVTSYSLYAPLFQRRLKYTQLQVNGVSIAAELALYLPVPLVGMMCDRIGPGLPALIAGALFGIGYFIAAYVYDAGPPPSAGGDGWPYAAMVLAFIPIGVGTSCIYICAVATCAKNFGRGKYKGLALAVPITAVGLSGVWMSQVGSQILYERRPDGSKGDVDVFRFFIFLGILFLIVGVAAFFLLQVVNEEELIDEAVEELEQSGLLTESEFFRASLDDQERGYGTMDDHLEYNEGLSASDADLLQRKSAELKARQLLERRKKTWLLNSETRSFLTDKTMWWLAAGFFLVTGPGEAFLNNLGTIIDTLSPPEVESSTNAATHVSIVAIVSTFARIVIGTVTDLLAPSALAHQHHRGPNSMANSLASLPLPSKGIEVSRMAFLIAFSLLSSLGQVLLASGAVQDHADRFWLVSASVGAGYGAVFSLTPIIISVVWGVENFGTNWGIVATVPAVGATVWGLVYSGVYQHATDRIILGQHLLGSAALGASEEADVLCYGVMCYAPTFWAMAVSVWIACGLWLYAWKGPGGWSKRGIAV